MDTNFLRFGIIGAGWIVDNVHIPTIKKLKMVKLQTIYDVDISRAESLCIKHSICKVSHSIDELLESGIDAVVVATPNYTHVDYTLNALMHGVSVLCEKPIAFHKNDVNKIIYTSNKNNTIFFPGYVNFYRKDICLLLKMLKENLVGDIVNIEAGWLRKNGIPKPGSWFTNKSLAGGGVLTDLGSHIVPICMQMVNNQMPETFSLKTYNCITNVKLREKEAQWYGSVSNKMHAIDVEESAIAKLNFPNAITMCIKVSWATPIDGDCTYFKIEGKKGSIMLKTLFGFSQQRLWDKALMLLEIEGKRKEIPLNFEMTNSAEYAFLQMETDFVNSILKRNNSNYMYSSLVGVEIIEKLYECQQVCDKPLFYKDR